MADYISRDAIDKWIVDSLAQYGNRYTTDQLNMFGLFRTVINDHSLFPAADVVERKKGKWIENSYLTRSAFGRAVWHKTYKCSECGSVFGREDDKYCYNCGCLMVGEDDG